MCLIVRNTRKSFKLNMYFEVYNSEDGVSIKKIDDIHAYLKEAIEMGHEFSDDFPVDPWDKSRKTFTRDSENVLLLLRGEIVQPKKKECVTKYEIED